MLVAGWRKSIPAIIPEATRNGRNPPQKLAVRFACPPTQAEIYIMKVSFNNSAGWKEIGPNSSQRLAPPLERPNLVKTKVRSARLKMKSGKATFFRFWYGKKKQKISPIVPGRSP